MGGYIKKLLVASFHGLLVLGSNGQFSSPLDPASVIACGAPSAAESVKGLTAAPEGRVGDTDQAASEQSLQGQQDAAIEEEPISDVIRKSRPSGKERDAILDRVNLGPGRPGGRDGPSRTEPDKGSK